jgi:hypothetical protein
MSGRMLVSGVMLGAFHHDHPAPQKHDHVVLTWTTAPASPSTTPAASARWI